MRKRLGILAFILVLIIVMTGCAKLLPGPEDTDPYLDTILDAVASGEYDTLLAQCTPQLRDNMTDDVQAAFSQYMQGSVVEYKRTSFQYNTVQDLSGVHSTRSVQYQVTTDVDRYLVSLVLVSENHSLFQVDSIRVLNSADVKASRGVVIDLQHLDAVHIIPLLCTAAALALIVIAVVSSIKADIRHKVLWILTSLLGTAGCIYSYTPRGIHIQFTAILTLPLSYSLTYFDGSLILRFMLPAGAILFLLLRKRLFKKKAAFDARKAALPNVIPPSEHTPQ